MGYNVKNTLRAGLGGLWGLRLGSFCCAIIRNLQTLPSDYVICVLFSVGSIGLYGRKGQVSIYAFTSTLTERPGSERRTSSGRPQKPRRPPSDPEEQSYSLVIQVDGLLAKVI